MGGGHSSYRGIGSSHPGNGWREVMSLGKWLDDFSRRGGVCVCE